MYNSGNTWESCRFVPETQELCFYEDRDGMQYSHPQQFDAKRPRLSNPNAYANSTVVVDQRCGDGSPQFLPRNEHCVNFNSPYVHMPQAPVAYTPPLPESPTYHMPNGFSPPTAVVPQFACGGGAGVMQQQLAMMPPPPVARQVITAAPYYNNEPSYAPCQNSQPWTYAYCYGYYNQQPCQFTEFVDIEDFMSNEKRKEKSRDAARYRRSRETEIFSELAQVLPLTKEVVDQLDKASVMRIAIAYLKIREMLQSFPKIKDLSEESSSVNNAESDDEEASETEEKEAKLFDLWKTAEVDKLLIQSLDGFLISLSNDGDVTYVSENIIEYLGISKIDILGQQIWEYSHQCDHVELKEALNIKKNGVTEKVKDENLIEEGITTDHRDLFIRLKCTLTSRGRSVNIKSATYKVIHITGHLVVNAKGDRVLIAIGRPIPHPSNIEIPLGTTTFLTKHSLDMKFTYVDDKMTSLFGYKPEDLLDKSLYECHHGGDSDSLMATFKSVLSKGQGETCRYRFLGKCGGYCWILTQATIVYDKQKPQSVVCVNYVISNLENNNEIYSLAQYEASQLEESESNVNTAEKPQEQQQRQQQLSDQPNELVENKPKPIQLPTVESNQPKDKKQNDDLVVVEVDLDSSLLPELSKKTCVDVDEKKSTSAVDLPLKREIPIIQNITTTTTPTTATPTTTTTNNKIINKSLTDQIKYIPSVTSFRALQHRPELFGGRPSIGSTTPPKYIEEKRPKSVTASVFRVANNTEKPSSIVGLNQNIGHHSIALNQSNLPQLNVAPRAQSVTASVFTPISHLHRAPQILQSHTQAKHLQNQQQQQQAPSVSRSVEMNKGYLSFAEDTTGLTMLKEEPDDLAHLAPTGVDACLPLDESTPFGEMLAGLMSYGGLLPDDINSLDSQHSGSQATGSTNNKGHIDPFINYREESNDTNCSQHLLSPSVTSKSPEASSLPSLCSPNSLSQEDDFPFMTMNVDDEIDLSMRAPYIPMNEQDDLPLLTDDLMWGVGFPSEDLAIHKDDAMQYNTLKQQMNLSTNNRLLNNNNNNNNCNSPNLANSSPSASPMSISSSSAASSPSPCSSNSSLSMHNQQGSSFGGAMLCNASGGGSGGGDGTGGGNSALNVDDSDSGISSINSMSPQHTHQQHQQQQQHHHQQQQHQQHHHQNHNQHQQQQHHSPMSIGNDSMGLMTCKKEIDGGNLCESIDAFDSVYNKDYCWVVEDLLNINSNDSSVAVDGLRQTHKQQNIIINTATLPTTTLHVPLITIQNNKNLSMNQQRTTSSPSVVAAAAAATAAAVTTNSSSSSSSSTTTPSSLSLSSSNCHNNSNSNKQCGSGSLILSEEIIQNNRKLTGKVPTSNTAATIRISNGNSIGRHQSSPKATILQTTNLTAALQQGNNNNHKRHLSTGGASALDSKRLKNSSTVEIQTSPHLLQQLMAPAPQKQRVVVKTASGGVYDKSQTTSRWTNENGATLQPQQLLRNHQQQQQPQNQQQQQDSNLNNHHLNQSLASSSSSSNSVLKNLLISGCDNIIVKAGPEIMITDDISNDSIAQLSPSDSFSSMRCETSTAKVMRSCRSNPMIGGRGLLPSPPFPSDDSNPPALLTMSDTESSSDSGIDESCTPSKAQTKNNNVLPDVTQKFYPNFGNIHDAVKSGDVLIANVDQRTNTATIQIQGTTLAAAAAAPQQQATTSKSNHRKSSISFMDNGNPLMTTFLMDLCNDDYNMNESAYLEDNDLVQVLNELTNDMVLSDDKA